MAQGKNYIIIGGIITTASLCSIHVLTEAFILQSKETLNQHARSMINLVVGIAILATTILGMLSKRFLQLVKKVMLEAEASYRIEMVRYTLKFWI